MARRGPNPQLELEQLLDYLESRAAATVLFSAESLTYWLSGESRESLTSFLSAVREASPITCLWTLRSVSDAMSSMYLRQLQNGRDVPSPAQFMRPFAEGPRRWEELFEGFRRVEDVVDGTVYVEYERDGSHNDTLLRTVGAPAAVFDALHGLPRLNARLTHKAAAAMVHTDEIARRAGLPIDRNALRDLFYRRGFRFENDGPCALVAGGLARALQEQAVAAARGCGFTPYLDFFGDHEVESASPVDIRSEVLDDDDLRRLVEHLSTAA